MHVKKQLRSTMSLRSCACPRSTTPIIMRLCLAGGRSGRPSIHTVYVYTYVRIYVYTRIINIGGFIIWRSVGRSAKAPNLIPRQIFRLYGNEATDVCNGDKNNKTSSSPGNYFPSGGGGGAAIPSLVEVYGMQNK